MLSNYKVDYRTNGEPKLFEFYLFINPLGKNCYKAELELTKAAQMINAKTDIHIISVTNPVLIERYMKQLGMPAYDIEIRNYIFNAVYQAALAYRAATLQGKKKGRLFLKSIQESVEYSLNNDIPRLIEQAAIDCKLDMEAFESDRNSEFVKNLFKRDQQIAKEMHVEHTPSLVIFEHCEGNEGIMITDNLRAEDILKEVDTLVESCLEKKHTSLPKNVSPISFICNRHK